MTAAAACLFALAGLASAQAAAPSVGSVTALYRRIGSLGLDPKAIYNVRSAALDREDIHITLDDGTIAFTEALNGHVTGALFVGEGSVLILPPNQVERHSLGMYTRSAVLNERFTTAYFRFDDPHFFSDLEPYMRTADDPAAFLERNDSVAKAMSGMDALRLLIALTRKQRPPANPAISSGEFIHARLIGVNTGTFDLSWDTALTEQIAAGQSSYTDQGAFYDQWMVFPMRSMRQREAERHRKGLSDDDLYADPIQIAGYKIRADVNPPTDLSVDAALDLNVRTGGDEVVLFELSRYLKVSSVTLDSGAGPPQKLEYVQNGALEGTQLARRGNDLIAIAFPAPLAAGQRFTLHFNYAGAVLSEAGGGLVYVGERGTWFPNRGPMMSNFDLQFTFPDQWKLLATGNRVSEETHAGTRTSHWVSERPMPFAGFNLGKYVVASAKTSGGTEIEAYAAEGMERTFPGQQSQAVVVPRGGRRPPLTIVPTAPPLVPAQNAKMVANKARDFIDFISPRIGGFPYGALYLTQMPGPDSQGWPGLVYLSSHVFLTPEERSQGRPNQVGSAEEIIYSHLMEAHETAHQWWGDAVFWRSYRDQWMMEALANYCALLQLEASAPNEEKAILDYYRKGLLTPGKGGTLPRKDAGPVSFGLRLNSSQFPGAYDTVAYGRGTWLIHMLRMMLRDSAPPRARPSLRRAKPAGPAPPAESADPDRLFFTALRNLQLRFAGKVMSTHDLQTAFEEVLPDSLRYEGKHSLDWFFEGWVNGTDIPRYELNDVKLSTAAGKTTARASLLQKGAPDSLITSVPIYAVLADGTMVFAERVFADGAETALRLNVPAGTKRLVVDPFDSVLTEK